MFKLEMQPPPGAVLRLLLGRLKVESDMLSDWLRRGREPYEKLATKAEFLAASRAWEKFFGKEDRTPEDVRGPAYRVEARRSLLYRLDEGMAYTAVALILVAFFVGLRFALAAGVAIAILGLALVAWLRRLGERRARAVIEWRQGLEPAVWALYYPLQVVSEVQDVHQQLQDAGDTTIGAQWAAMEDGIARDADGRALPGQEDKLRAAAAYLTTELPHVLGRIDAGRLIGSMILGRAPVAAELVRTEMLHQIGGSSSTASTSVAERTAKDVYGYLIEVGERFIRLPRPPEASPGLNAPLASVVSEKYFQTLVAEVSSLKSAALDLAHGQLPSGFSAAAELPGRNFRVLQVLGGVMAILGFYLIFAQPAYVTWGNALVSAGSVLLPGTLGRLVEKTAAVRSPGLPAKA